ncbi:MAG: hypothetical protein QNL91_10860 [Candidatus Krumholzibacteria bacterium]|nr:hypothetical protein [Candidatus Krumholzibacteria bacterium]
MKSWPIADLRIRNFTATAVVVSLCLCLGCSSSTDPVGDEDPVAISFRPAAQGQEIDLTQTIEFSVSAPEANTINVNWWRDGIIISNAETYTYVPSSLGADTLKVQVQADGFDRGYFWVINVESIPSVLPPPVPMVQAEAGPEPGDVLVTWNKVGASEFPMAEYVVALSFTGPINLENWTQALELRRVTHRVLQVGYEENFTVADDGMVPGAEVWVAVRAVDDLGQMSLIGDIGYTVTTTRWWLNGVVLDERSQVLPGIIVASVEPQISTNTENSGTFRLGPFRNIDRVVLTTNSSNAPISGWYDFESVELDSVSGRDLAIRLITRHTLDVDCDLYEGQFLHYFRFMTRTLDDIVDPEAAQVRRFENFPLRAYVPDFVNAQNVDYAAAARFAMAFWDSVMGEPYFTPTSVQSEAQVIFTFDNSSPNLFGEARLLEPAAPGVKLGDVIPEVTEVYLRSDFSTAKFTKEVALHELGHILGLLSHSGCVISGHLMTVAASGSLSNENPIHPDEQNAVRTLRYLPQSIDMGSYSLSK